MDGEDVLGKTATATAEGLSGVMQGVTLGMETRLSFYLRWEICRTLEEFWSGVQHPAVPCAGLQKH